MIFLFFKQAKYICSTDKNYLDSIFLTSPKAIKIQKRWYRKIPERCCFGECWRWAINIKVSVKNKMKSEFFYDSKDVELLSQKVARNYHNVYSGNIDLGKKIILEKQERDEYLDDYVLKLKKEI